MSTWEEHKRLAAQPMPDRDGYESAAQYARERREAAEEAAQQRREAWEAIDTDNAEQDIEHAMAEEAAGAECVKVADKYAASLGLHWPDKPQEGTQP